MSHSNWGTNIPCQYYTPLAALTRSLTSLVSDLMALLVFSSSFSWAWRFSRKYGESVRHSVNSRGRRPMALHKMKREGITKSDCCGTGRDSSVTRKQEQQPVAPVSIASHAKHNENQDTDGLGVKLPIATRHIFLVACVITGLADICSCLVRKQDHCLTDKHVCVPVCVCNGWGLITISVGFNFSSFFRVQQRGVMTECVSSYQQDGARVYLEN